MTEVAAAVIILLIYAIAGLLVVILVPLAQMQKVKDVLHQSARVRLENELRRTTIQVVGGFGLVLSLFFAWRTLTFNETTASRTLNLTEEARNTERANALASNDPAIRLNAIYELSDVAQNMPARRQQIEDLLTYWVRHQSKKEHNEWPGQRTELETALRCVLGSFSRFSNVTAPVRPRSLDLSGADLSNLKLVELNFSSVDLAGTNLSDTDLTYTDLRGANLRGANIARAQILYAITTGILIDSHTIFDEANLQGANLENVILSMRTLKQVNFYDANLKGANFIGAVLDHVNLNQAVLTDAHFEAANLESVQNLKKSQLNLAKTDSTTRLPKVFAPE